MPFAVHLPIISSINYNLGLSFRVNGAPTLPPKSEKDFSVSLAIGFSNLIPDFY
jgi:hypothetical protein